MPSWLVRAARKASGRCHPHRPAASLVRFTDIAADIARESRGLLLSFQVPPAEIRGLGIQVRPGCPP